MEGREHRVTEPFEGKMQETSGSATISTKLERIAKLARNAPNMAFTTLAHHIDLAWLREAYRRTRKDGAPGVDQLTAAEYESDLEGNLRSLLERTKSGTYRAMPVRRVHIPKGTGRETRPLGIPAFEDKVLQRAVTMVLEAIYEQDFSSCSYGFRPKRSAHQALGTIWEKTTRTAGGWVLEIDIRRYFDTIDHRHLREILRRRVLDGVLLRLIGKWLNAGVLEDGVLTYPRQGSPQGGVISPLLANIYLHEVLDVWFERVVQPRMRGRVELVRYADDAILLFEREDDAERVMSALPKRFERYGLTLHPEKTRLVEFVRPDRRARRVTSAVSRRPGTFDFLGFMHFWGRSRTGKWIMYRATARDRFRRGLKQISDCCREHRHDDLRVQQRMIAWKLQGHIGYYGIIGNARALGCFRHEVIRIWQKWLSRRSQRAYVDWPHMTRLLERYPLPAIRIMRPMQAVNP
jgi:RNA-directed DNA polymerase